jgi:hypothetical protein
MFIRRESSQGAAPVWFATMAIWSEIQAPSGAGANFLSGRFGEGLAGIHRERGRDPLRLWR